MSIAMIVIGIGLVVRTLIAGGGALATGSFSAFCSCWPAWPACICSCGVGGSSGSAEPHVKDRPFSYRALFAVVYTASVHFDVVARWRRRAPRQRLRRRRCPGGRPVLRPDRDDLRRGGVAPSRAWRIGRVRAVRLQRARELRRRLGDLFLDFPILIAVTALTVPSYLAAFAAPIGRGSVEIAVAFAVIALVAVDNLTGVSARRLRTRVFITIGDLILQALIIVLGFVLVFDPHNLTASINLGTAPSWSDLAFALPIAVIAFTGIEAAASIAGEVSATRRQVKLIVGPGSALIVLIYVGISLVGVGALPVHHGVTALGTTHIKAPVLGVVEAFHPRWLADVLKYAVAIGGALGLFAAAGSAMLGVSRVGYSLATNRQIPSAVGRLHERWGTPYVIIGAAAIAAAALVLPRDLEFLVGIYAFGASAGVHDRARLGDRPAVAARARSPLQRATVDHDLRGERPMPAVAGAVASALGWVALLVFHAGARYVGLAWLLSGLLLYVVYRKSQQKPLLRRVTIPSGRSATRRRAPGRLDPRPDPRDRVDDDIVQTAGRLAGETRDDLESDGAVMEAIWVFEIPLRSR